MTQASKISREARLSGIPLVITASVCWSTSGILISLITKESGLSAAGLAFWRELVTSIILLLGILIINPKLLIVKKNDLPWLIAMGSISIAIFHILWNKAVVTIGASLATVVAGNSPIFVTILAWFLFGEKITLRKVAAVSLAVAGTVLVSGINTVGEWKITPLGLWIALASALAYGSISLFGKKLRGNYNTWTILFYIFSIGTLMLYVMQLGQPDPWPSSTKFLPLFTVLVLVSTIFGFSLYTTSLKYLPASVASITATSEIFFASILAAIILQERMDALQILGAILIIAGVILVSFTKAKNILQE